MIQYYPLVMMGDIVHSVTSKPCAIDDFELRPEMLWRALGEACQQKDFVWSGDATVIAPVDFITGILEWILEALVSPGQPGEFYWDYATWNPAHLKVHRYDVAATLRVLLALGGFEPKLQVVMYNGLADIPLTHMEN